MLAFFLLFSWKPCLEKGWKRRDLLSPVRSWRSQQYKGMGGKAEQKTKQTGNRQWTYKMKSELPTSWVTSPKYRKYTPWVYYEQKKKDLMNSLLLAFLLQALPAERKLQGKGWIWGLYAVLKFFTPGTFQSAFCKSQQDSYAFSRKWINEFLRKWTSLSRRNQSVRGRFIHLPDFFLSASSGW